MTLRGALVEVHSWIGLTAGLLIAVIGLSGALLAFRAEITEALDPALFKRPAPAVATADTAAAFTSPAGAPEPLPLSPAALIRQLALSHPHESVQSLTLYQDPHHPVRVVFAPPPGERRGERHWVDPWNAETLAEPRAEPFFETVEALHRWLLLPRDDGKPITGSLAILLIVLSVTGLYLRWPRRLTDWRAWLQVDLGLRGRALLWNLHAVAGTVALLCYLISAATGLYWAFDSVRRVVDNAVGESRPARIAAPGDPARPLPRTRPDLDRVWQAFQSRREGRWQEVNLRLPVTGSTTVEVNVLPVDAAHERARDRLSLDAVTGTLLRERRHTDLTAPNRLVNSFYALHLGTFWGLPGRIIMALASLTLVGFAVTGWMLYLGRRRQRRASEAERLRAAEDPGTPPPQRDDAPILVAFASQTGQAERLAWQTARALRRAGRLPEVRSLARIAPDELARNGPLLLVATSTGDGEPPDAVRRFARLIEHMHQPLQPAPSYGLLALGDRHYPQFCGFGRSLDSELQRLGARALFPRIEVDGLDPAALSHWAEQVGSALGHGRQGAGPADTGLAITGLPDDGPPDDGPVDADDWTRLTILDRAHVNPGSPGQPLYRIRLQAPAGAHWAPGALLEVLPPPPAGSPPSVEGGDGRPRSYSIASLPDTGVIELWVRENRRADGSPGRVSDWFAHCAPGQTLEARLRRNPGFALIDDDRPCVFIGNGSGYAGLRAHLLERARRGHARNWLVFGERHAAHDAYFGIDVEAWRTAGMLERVDLAWSRDPGQPRRHVQDALSEAGDTLRQWIDEGAVLYVCGSREGMGTGVTAALEALLDPSALAALRDEGREYRDLY